MRKEADEILSKATIIRDTFILKEDSNAKKLQKRESSKSSPPQENRSNGSNCVSQTPVSETMTQNQVSNTECALVQNASSTKSQPKENGQVETTDNSVSPGNVAVDVADDSKEKKNQKKCCTIM